MNKKKKAAVGAAAAVVALASGLAVHQAFEPAELLHNVDDPAKYAQTIQTYRTAADAPLAELGSYERMTLADAVRGRIIRLPVAVKSAVLLPLWCLGAIPAALGTALAPLWGVLLGLLIQLGILLGLFCVIYKLLFPKRKLRELFRKKNLKWLLLGAVTVTAANVLLAQLWTGWPVLRAVLLGLAGFGILCLLWKRLCGAFCAPKPETVRTTLVMGK